MVPVRLDEQDRHLLAVAAVWVVVVLLGLPLGALLLGATVRLFLWTLGAG